MITLLNWMIEDLSLSIILKIDYNWVSILLALYYYLIYIIMNKKKKERTEPTFTYNGIYVWTHLDNNVVGDTAWDVDMGDLKWNGTEWKQYTRKVS
jgi:hypothetical protein